MPATLINKDRYNGKFVKKPVVPTDTSMTSEQTGEQNPGEYSSVGSIRPAAPLSEFGFLWGNGGSWDNPLGFPGYGSLYTGRYDTYRFMLQHPTLRLVRSIAIATISSSKWEYQGENVEDVAFIKSMFDPLREKLMADFFARGRDYGWVGGEPIWELRGNQTWLARVKPLLNEVTHCLKDDFGNFVGLRNGVQVGTKPEVDISAPYKAWKYTYDSEAGYFYGRSWLENVRSTAWRDWLDCAQQLQKLGAKITGIQLILTTPGGSIPGPNNADGTPGKPIPYRDIATNLIKALANGAPGAWLPSMTLPTDVKGNLNTAKIIAELAQKSLIKADLLNHGTNTPAILGILERMKHNEQLMFEGGLRPSRTGKEAEHGAKADADTHTETGTQIAELEDRDFASQVQPLVDAALVLNRGIGRKGTVRIVPPSLVDRKTSYLKAFMLACMNDPAIAQVMMETIDVDHELDFIGITRKTNFDPKKVIAARKAQSKQNTNKKPEGGRPTN